MRLQGGAVVVRLARAQTPEEPLLRTEYLSVDGAVPAWSGKRHEAVFFRSFTEARARAALIPRALPARCCEEARQ